MKVDGRIAACRMASRDPAFLFMLAELDLGKVVAYPPKVAIRHYLRMLQNVNQNWMPKYFLYKPLDDYLYVVRIR